MFVRLYVATYAYIYYVGMNICIGTLIKHVYKLIECTVAWLSGRSKKVRLKMT